LKKKLQGRQTYFPYNVNINYQYL